MPSNIRPELQQQSSRIWRLHTSGDTVLAAAQARQLLNSIDLVSTSRRERAASAEIGRLAAILTLAAACNTVQLEEALPLLMSVREIIEERYPVGSGPSTVFRRTLDWYHADNKDSHSYVNALGDMQKYLQVLLRFLGNPEVKEVSRAAQSVSLEVSPIANAVQHLLQNTEPHQKGQRESRLPFAILQDQHASWAEVSRNYAILGTLPLTREQKVRAEELYYQHAWWNFRLDVIVPQWWRSVLANMSSNSNTEKKSDVAARLWSEQVVASPGKYTQQILELKGIQQTWRYMSSGSDHFQDIWPLIRNEAHPTVEFLALR